MTESASLVLTRNRGSPKPRTPRKEREPSVVLIESPSHATREVAQAIAELKELDQTMTSIDHQLNHLETQMTDPSLDEWDRIDLEPQIDALTDQRSKARFDLLFAANRVNYFGAYLIGEWRETDLDNIARQLNQPDGLFSRVADEWPGASEHPVWQRVYSESCPY